MDLEQTKDPQENVYSKRLKAGKRWTYFFDVKPTTSGNYYVAISESTRKDNGEGFEKSKIHIFKEDFKKFLKGLNNAVDFVKTELMPNFDFESFDRHDTNDKLEINQGG